MENNLEEKSLFSDEMTLSPVDEKNLNDSAKWGQFLAIMGFIFGGLLCILALFIGTLFNSIGGGFGAITGGASVFISILYLVLAVLVYIIPSRFLYMYSSKMKNALLRRDRVALSESFKNHKSLYTYLGIMLIILISIYLLIFLFGMMASLFG